MAYLGSWKIDDFITVYCNTHAAATGVATDADAVPTYRIYEDETGAAIANGNMALLDAANTVGFYSERVQLLAATGFEKGRQYSVYISATVATIEGTMHHTFQIEAEVDANIVSDSVNVTLIEGADATDQIRDAVLDDATRFSGTDIAAILVDTGTTLPATLAIEANVQGHATAALNAYDPPTRAEATADKDAIITEVNANETKIDAIPTAAEIDTQLSGTHGAGAWDGSEADWTVAEKKQIRDALGVDGVKVTAASGQVQTIQADLDDPDQYKADVSALATAAALAVAQADLDNPNQYKANVSALAVEANVAGHATTALNTYDPPTRAEATADKAEIIAEVDANETKIDAMTALVDFINDIQGGGLQIVDNQLILTEDDNVTVVATFDLFDADGQPAMTNVMRRTRA